MHIYIAQDGSEKLRKEEMPIYLFQSGVSKSKKYKIKET